MGAASENGSSTNDTIQLELRSRLNQAGIVHSFVFNTKANSVILSLNHAYDGKTVICPINYRQWIRSVDNFIKQLKRKGISKEHINYICDTLDSNYEKILEFEDSNKEQKSEQEQEERIENVLMDMYHFRTMSDTREIYYYDENKGIYVNGAEIVVESQAELMTDGTVSEDEHTLIGQILMPANCIS